MLCFHLFLSICIHLRLSFTHDWWLFSGANLVLGFLISKAGVDSYLWLLQKEQGNTGCSHPVIMEFKPGQTAVFIVPRVEKVPRKCLS